MQDETESNQVGLAKGVGLMECLLKCLLHSQAEWSGALGEPGKVSGIFFCRTTSPASIINHNFLAIYSKSRLRLISHNFIAKADMAMVLVPFYS